MKNKATENSVGRFVMNKSQARSALPPSLPPRGLSRIEASAYIGISHTLFDELVSSNRMPTPKKINTRSVWDLRELDLAFSALSPEQEINEWD